MILKWLRASAVLLGAIGFASITQAAPVLLLSASATARVEMVGPVFTNSAESKGFWGWLMRTSTAGLLW